MPKNKNSNTDVQWLCLVISLSAVSVSLCVVGWQILFIPEAFASRLFHLYREPIYVVGAGLVIIFIFLVIASRKKWTS